MKKAVACGLIFGLTVCGVQASTITWGYTGSDLAGLGFSSTWSVRLFIDSNNDNNFSGSGNYTIGVDDVYASEETFLGLDKSGNIIWGTSYNVPGTTVGLGDYVYTVVYNNADAALATQYIIINTDTLQSPTDALVNVPAHTLGSVGGTWQAVPEPSTLALLGIGLATAAVARKKRRNES